MTRRVGLVTGAAHRVGRAIVLALAAHGLDVVVHYNRSESEARDTLQTIESLGVEAFSAQADLATPGGAARLMDQTLQRFGRIDLLVNSAAIMQAGGVLTLTPEEWDQTLNINLRGPFLCSQHAARRMVEQPDGGVIVNIADMAGLEPWAKYPAHSVSKAGLIMLTQVTAKALGPKVRVNAVAPGPVAKPPDWADARWQAVGSHTALKRPGKPEDVARAVIFLLENDYVTGETLVVDGGGRLF